MGPHGLCVGATGSGKSELLRTLVAGAGGHAPARGPVADPRRLQGRRRVRAVRAAAARRRDHHQPGRRRRASSSGRARASPARWCAASRCCKDAGNSPTSPHYARCAREQPDLPPLPHLLRRHRRVRRAAHRRARLHRPVPRHRPHRPVDRRAPAAVQPAHRGGKLQRPGHLPVVPDRAADLLRGGRVAYGAGHPRRVPPAAAARLRLPQGRHHRLRAVQGGLRLRPVRAAERAGAGGGRGAAPAARAPACTTACSTPRHRDRRRRRGRAASGATTGADR